MVCQLSNLPQATAASRYFTLEVPVGLFAAQGSVCGSSVSGHHEKRLMYSKDFAVPNLFAAATLASEGDGKAGKGP